jgi:iron complex outermembrane receptor protein
MNGSTIGGSINFNLKEAFFNCENTPSIMAYSQFGSVNNGLNNGLNVNLNNNKMAVRLAGTYRKVGNYYAGGGHEIKFTQYEKYNLQFNTVLKLSSNHSIIADLIHDKGINIGYAALPMDVSSATANIYSLTHRLLIKKLYKAVLESKVYYNEVVHYMDDTNRPETPIHMDMPGWSNTLGFYSKLNIEKQKHSFQTRIDGHKAYTRADMTMYPKNEKEMFMQTLPGNELLNWGCAIQYQYQLNEKFGIGAAYRQDYFQQIALDEIGILQWEGFGFDVSKPLKNWLHSGSLWIERKNKIINSKLLFASGARIASSNERLGLYLFNRADGYDYLGNYHLMPEQAFQTDFINNFKIKKVSITTTLFFHRINDYIYAYTLPNYSAMTIGARGVKTYKNIRFAHLTGFESTIGFKILNNIWYKTNMRYTYALLSNDMYMQQVPPLKILNTVRFQNDSMQLQLEHLFANNQNLINNDFGEIKTSSWHTFNIRFSYTKKLRNSILQMNVAIENIFDINYREHLDWGRIPQPGRNFVFGINYYLN